VNRAILQYGTTFFQAIMHVLPTLCAHARFGAFCKALARGRSGESAALLELKAVLLDVPAAVFAGIELHPLFFAEIAEYANDLSSVIVECAVQRLGWKMEKVFVGESVVPTEESDSGEEDEGWRWQVVAAERDFHEQVTCLALGARPARERIKSESLGVMALALELFPDGRGLEDERWAIIKQMPWDAGRITSVRELLGHDLSGHNLDLNDDVDVLRLYVARYALVHDLPRAPPQNGPTLEQALQALPCGSVQMVFLAPIRFLLDNAALRVSKKQVTDTGLIGGERSELSGVRPVFVESTMRAAITVSSVLRMADSLPAGSSGRDHAMEVHTLTAALAYSMNCGRKPSESSQLGLRKCQTIFRHCASSEHFSNDSLTLLKFGVIGVDLDLKGAQISLSKERIDSATIKMELKAVETLWVHRNNNGEPTKGFNDFENDIFNRAKVRSCRAFACHLLTRARRAEHMFFSLASFFPSLLTDTSRVCLFPLHFPMFLCS
jgi:hypothetical protein